MSQKRTAIVVACSLVPYSLAHLRSLEMKRTSHQKEYGDYLICRRPVTRTTFRKLSDTAAPAYYGSPLSKRSCSLHALPKVERVAAPRASLGPRQPGPWVF